MKQRIDLFQQEQEQEWEAIRREFMQRLGAEQKERESLAQKLQVLVQNHNALHIVQEEKPAGKQKKV